MEKEIVATSLTDRPSILPPKCPPAIFAQLPLANRYFILGHLPDLDIFF